MSYRELRAYFALMADDIEEGEADLGDGTVASAMTASWQAAQRAVGGLGRAPDPRLLRQLPRLAPYEPPPSSDN